MTTMTIARTAHPTRLGNLTIEASAFGLTRVAFSADTTAPTTDLGFGRAHAFEAGRQIDEYLAGARRHFTVPIDWSRMTAFDAIALQTLCASTGYGETISYGAIAQRHGPSHLGRPQGRWRVGTQSGADHRAVPPRGGRRRRPDRLRRRALRQTGATGPGIRTTSASPSRASDRATGLSRTPRRECNRRHRRDRRRRSARRECFRRRHRDRHYRWVRQESRRHHRRDHHCPLAHRECSPPPPPAATASGTARDGAGAARCGGRRRRGRRDGGRGARLRRRGARRAVRVAPPASHRKGQQG